MDPPRKENMNALEQAKIEARHDDEFAFDDSNDTVQELLEELLEARATLRLLEDEIPAGPLSPGRRKMLSNLDVLIFWRKEVYRLENAYIAERVKAEAAADAANPDRWKRSEDDLPF